MLPPIDSCTTISGGKNATHDGPTTMERTEVAGAGFPAEKKHVIVKPEDQPRHHKSIHSKFGIDLPDSPLQ